ncbi:effector-associated domain EAD1-containing protein [Myxococcus sp. Y35]|uniref:VMAP-C domain-containing protein n=1 Tax=Pseudomyxococcus flavus TaxID=3115648 RepID=UPI003CF5B6E3
MTLRPDQRAHLQTALLKAFPEHGDLNGLSLLVFGCPLDQVAMGDDLTQIALRVIMRAESHGQVEALVRGALTLRADATQLKAFADIHLDNVFSEQEQQAFVDAARGGGFTNEVLQSYFRRSWPARGPGAVPVEHGGNLLPQLVKELGDAPTQTDGSTPLLHFAALLQLQARGTAAASKLKKWLVEASAQRGVDVEALLRQVNQHSAEQEGSLFLLLRLEKAPEGRCTVQAWLSQGEQGAMVSIHADDEPRDLSSVGALLNEFLGRISGDLEASDGRLIIEVMLPQELLCYTVERWELEQGRHKPLCGRKYPVVVRSWERAYDPRLSIQVRPDWTRKWKDFQEQPPAGLPRAVIWEPDPAEAGALFDRLIEAGVVCLALMHPQEGSAATSEELSACIDSGTPIALWGRKWPAGLVESRVQVQRLLADLRQLPARVRDMRARAHEEAHVGHSLVLLWDNPNRLPPDALRTRRLVLPST